MMKSLRNHESVRPSGSTGMDGENAEGRSGVIGNERLTALAGAVLLVLIVVELVTVANLRAGLAVHVLIGVLLAGPLAVKLGSTGYRFLRYYTGSPASAGTRPAAAGDDPRSDRQWDRTRGDRPASSWSTSPRAWHEYPALAP